MKIALWSLGGTAMYPNQLRSEFRNRKELDGLDFRIQAGAALPREFSSVLSGGLPTKIKINQIRHTF